MELLRAAPIPARLAGEGDAPWNAFKHYLLMGAPKDGTGVWGKRTFSDVARLLGHADQSACGKWAAEYNWIERVTEWDQARLALVVEDIVDIQREHMDLARRLVRLAKRKLAKLEARQETELEDETMSAHAVTELLKQSIVLERLVGGQSTENVSVRGRVALDLSNAPQELLEALDGLRKKSLPGR